MAQLANEMKTAATMFGMHAKFYYLKFSKNEKKKELLSDRFTLLGDKRLVTEKPVKAQAAYEKALLLSENTLTRLKLGSTCLEERHFNDARKHFEKVAASEQASLKEKLSAYEGIMKSYDSEGMMHDAAKTCIRISLVYFEANNPVAGKKYAIAALSLQPKHEWKNPSMAILKPVAEYMAPEYCNAGTEIFSPNNMHTIMPAKNYFDMAISLSPNLADAYYGRALCELYLYDLARSMGYGQADIKHALFDLHQALKFGKEAEHIDEKLAATILEYSRSHQIYDSKNLRKAAQAIIEKFGKS